MERLNYYFSSKRTSSDCVHTILKTLHIYLIFMIYAVSYIFSYGRLPRSNFLQLLPTLLLYYSLWKELWDYAQIKRFEKLLKISGLIQHQWFWKFLIFNHFQFAFRRLLFHNKHLVILFFFLLVDLRNIQYGFILVMF